MVRLNKILGAVIAAGAMSLGSTAQAGGVSVVFVYGRPPVRQVCVQRPFVVQQEFRECDRAPVCAPPCVDPCRDAEFAAGYAQGYRAAQVDRFNRHSRSRCR